MQSVVSQIEQVFREEEPKLVNYLTKVFHDAESASDVAQHAFLCTLEYKNRDQIENIRGFIYATARNLARNEIRRAGRYKTRFKDAGDFLEYEMGPELESSEPTPEHAASLKQDIRALEYTINCLPQKVKQAFLLSRIEDMNYKEIATRLSVSESSVEKYIMKALKELRSQFIQLEWRDHNRLRKQ